MTRSAFHHRLARLNELYRSPVVVPAGHSQPRNYAANGFPFRASSHFLYFAGMALEGAVLRADGKASVLYATPPDADDALWHGATPSLSDLANTLEMEVRPLSELALTTSPMLLPSDLKSRALYEPFRDAQAAEALHTAVVQMRLQHDECAQVGLREAARVTTLVHHAGRRSVRGAYREYDVVAAMEAVMRQNACVSAYSPIVTVHGDVLHNHSYANHLSPGDMLLADVGAEVESGYAGDVTRVWPVSGRFSSTQKLIYELVLLAQEEAIAGCVVGAEYRTLHLTAARTMTRGLVDLGILRGDVDTLVAEGVHALFFPHGLGHLLGLDVHDMEDLGDTAGYAAGRSRSAQFGLGYLRLDRPLMAGMAVTIEPGFYQPEAMVTDPRFAKLREHLRLDELAKFSDVRGIRIEDDVLISDSGPTILTAGIPKSIEALEATE